MPLRREDNGKELIRIDNGGGFKLERFGLYVSKKRGGESKLNRTKIIIGGCIKYINKEIN